MEKSYTFGQVFDIMKFGEVAVKIEGLEGKADEKYSHSKIGSALYFDELDLGIIKLYPSNKEIVISKDEDGKPEKYVIMSREAYDKIRKMY